MSRLQHKNFLRQGSTCPIEIDGELFHAIAGESIAAALAAAGKLALKRDKNGAPRGLFCGMGACFDCQVSIDGGPAQRACLAKVQPRMAIRTLDYRAEILLPDTEAQRHNSDKLECDVLIVGAGPAGMSTAIQLAEAGLAVIVADERSGSGGQFYKQLASSYFFIQNSPVDSQYRDGAVLIERLKNTNAQILLNANVWGAYRNEAETLEICVAAESKSYVVNPRQLVLASGAYESVPAFPGWTLPGVMTTGAAQTLVRAYRVAPGKRVIIAGNGPLNLQLAYELVKGGVDVVAIAESAPWGFPRNMLAAIGATICSPSLILRGIGYLGTLIKMSVPIYHGHNILRADGEDKVHSASIARIGRDARIIPNSEKVYDVDALCIGYALHPSNELARWLGCEHKVVAPGLLAPVRNPNGQTSISDVFVIGDGGVLGGAHVAMAEGRIAAQAILRNLSKTHSGSERRNRLSLSRHRQFQRFLWSLYRAPEISPALPNTPVCRCELVTLETIRSLIEDGIHDLGSIKRISRAGMGPCQGRYCQYQIAKILGEMTGNVPEPEELFAPQLPVKPVVISKVSAEKPEWRGYRTVELVTANTKATMQESIVEKTDTLVIGAGIIGIATALYLAREGIDVIVLDRGVPNGQASGSNAGSLHLQLLSFDYSDECDSEITPAASALKLQKMGIDEWLNLSRDIGGNFGIELTGGIMVAENESDLAFLRKKASLEKTCGIDVDILSKVDLGKVAPAVSNTMFGAAYCAGEGKINPMQATQILCSEACKFGARIRAQTAVVGISKRKRRYIVATTNGTFSCHRIVNAAGGWSANIASMIGAILPVRTAPQQMIVTESAVPVINHLIAHARRHLTMKQVANGNIIIGGGWPASYDAKTSRAVTVRESLEGNLWAAERVVPAIGQLQMIRSWATIGVMIDGAPIVGELPGNPGFFNAVGANGYTMGPILGQITAELIRTGRPIADIQPFSVERFH